MEIAPDGKLFIAEQGGTLEVWQGGAQVQANFFADTPLTVNPSGERGLLGIAFDPNYASNRFVYVYYTATTPTIHNRVSRFTANAAGDLALAGSEAILLDLETLSATNHNGGAIHFGPDGKLYIAVGENAVTSNSQLLTNRLGKILRINSDGTIPADNPSSFQGVAGTTSGVNRAIWAIGLRNPYTASFQAGTGRFFINDVGSASTGRREEINDGIAGRNFGWSVVEGIVGNPNYTDPLLAYGASTPGYAGNCAITGGAFYNPAVDHFSGSTNPAASNHYLGDYFFSDFCGGFIRRFDPARNTVDDFATGISLPVDLKVGADGSLLYLARGTGQVFRVTGSANPAIQVVDNNDPGFAITGGWTYSPQERAGVLNDIHYVSAGTGTRTASWTFPVTTGRTYRVSATWNAQSNRATNAPFAVLQGTTTLGTRSLNQELAPGDFVDAGAAWEDLGTFTIGGSSLTVQLTDLANEFVIADAVRVELLPDPASLRVIDDGDAGFTTTAGWTDSPQEGAGVQNDIHYAPAGVGTRTASWTALVTAGRTYRVSVTWPAQPNRATNAPFAVLQGSTVLGSVAINQEQNPNDFVDAGAAWEDLGVFTVGGPLLTVRLSDLANEFVIADAVRVELLPDPATLRVVDDGGAGFATTAGWTYSPQEGAGVQNDIHYAPAGAGARLATWIVPVSGGNYRVSVSWNAQSNRATNAPFAVLQGTTTLGTRSINQELAPNDFVDAGVAWEDLGTFTVGGPTLVVRLSDLANEFVIADAVRVELLP